MQNKSLLLIFILAVVLTGCAQATPKATQSDPDGLKTSQGVIGTPAPLTTINDNGEIVTLPTPTPGALDMQAWERYNELPANAAAQEIAGEISLGDHALANYPVVVCVDGECIEDGTDGTGKFETTFPNCGWSIGVVPFSVCVTLTDEQPVCLRAAFVVTEAQK